MARIDLQHVTVTFPIYDASRASLKSALLGGAGPGGALVRGAGKRSTTEIRALDQVDLHLEEGDRLALIGHNGAGKSTLLRVLAGIYEPGAGQVSIVGTAVPMFNITLGLDMESTGYENILLRGLYLGLSRAQIDQRLDEIAELSGLEAYLHLPMRTYSTGMRMRLAFSVCTAIHPDILLIDEGLGTADAAFMEKARRRIVRFSEQASILVLAAHHPELLRKLCNKAVLLEHGRLSHPGSVDDVLEAYRQRRTAI